MNNDRSPAQDERIAQECHHLEVLLERRKQDRRQATHPPFAALYFTWDELDRLAGMVDDVTPPHGIATDPEWSERNALRTALREAQYSIEPRR